MKKTLALVLVLAAVAAAAIVFFFKGPETREMHAADLAPADCLVFWEASDVHRTLDRWKQTSIYQITQEPEWQAFVAKFGDLVTDNLPDKSLSEAYADIKEADPANGFLAMTSVAESQPIFVGGFSYRGKKTAAKSAIEKLRAGILQFAPAQKSELVKAEGTEIEVVTLQGTTLAFAYRDNWFFFANGLDPMKGLLQRYAGGKSAGLSSDAVFVDAAKQGVLEPDFAVFARVKKMAEIEKVERHARYKGAGVPPEPPSPLEAFIPEVVHYSLKLDGLLMRDRAYVRIPNWPKAGALVNRSIAVTSPNSFGYGVMNFAGMENFTRPLFALTDEEEKNSDAGKKLKEKGLKFADLGEAFGPEVAFYSDWPTGAPWPTFFLGVEVRDTAKGRIFAETLVPEMASASKAEGPVEENGVVYWTLLGKMDDALALAVAYDGKHLVFALNKAEANEGLKHLKDGGSNLAQSETFKNAVKTVVTPTGGLSYLDLKQLIERVYAMYVDTLKGQLANSPVAKYIDPSKFPKAETITKHLLPSVISYGDAPEGFVVDAAGSISMYGTMLPMGAAWFVAIPRSAPMPLAPPPAPVATGATGTSTTTDKPAPEQAPPPK